MDSTGISPHLLSISRILKSSFPDGIQGEDYRALMSVLYSEFSHRNLAELLSHSFDIDYYGVLNDVYGVASRGYEPDADAVDRVKGHLIAHGYSEWLSEQDDT